MVVLAGLETEYGLAVEGRSVQQQTEDSLALVRALRDECFVGWDYRFEASRRDLRGFVVDHLTVDPADAALESEGAAPALGGERGDRVLVNGARFYNDHGHPEYATPECLGLDELVRQDIVGQQVALRAAQAYRQETGREALLYKNNTDFSGSSYGTHESYLVPRSVPFADLMNAVIPVLVARQVLCGAGKVGSEARGPVNFQISQRADHMTETASVDTLYRRPVFNTRDEPHAVREDWIRLHVINGDANMLPSSTRLKIALVKIALAALRLDKVPQWTISDPARSMMLVSRDPDGEGRIELEGSSWTTARQVLESYLDAVAGDTGDAELEAAVTECRQLLDDRVSRPDTFRRHVDWAAKRWLVEQYRDGGRWNESALQSVDLAYSLIDPDQSLYYALVEAGEVDEPAWLNELGGLAVDVQEPTRALARSLAIQHFSADITGVSWGNIRFRTGGKEIDIALPPDKTYSFASDDLVNVESFVRALSSL